MSIVKINDEMKQGLASLRKIGEIVNNKKYNENEVIRPEFTAPKNVIRRETK